MASAIISLDCCRPSLQSTVTIILCVCVCVCEGSAIVVNGKVMYKKAYRQKKRSIPLSCLCIKYKSRAGSD